MVKGTLIPSYCTDCCGIDVQMRQYLVWTTYCLLFGLCVLFVYVCVCKAPVIKFIANSGVAFIAIGLVGIQRFFLTFYTSPPYKLYLRQILYSSVGINFIKRVQNMYIKKSCWWYQELNLVHSVSLNTNDFNNACATFAKT